MTQEEKAKAYDEALKKAKAIVNSINVGLIGKNSFEAVFPELKENENESENESKDEKIRKELISHFCAIRDNCGKDWYGYDINDVISWLEKQGDHANFRNKIQVGDRVTRNEDGVLVNMSQLERVAKPKRNIPSDKIKPKFKVGDWIITDKKHIWYIDEISKTTLYMYVLINRYGKIMVADFETVDKKARFWTIKDAEDGDILAAEPINDFPGSFIAIYKERGLDFFNSHCCVSYDGKFYKDITGHDIHHIHPAIKEQSDTLFAKMKEAGYKWDFNKKELRKIEQSPVEWSEEDNLQLQAAVDICKSSGHTITSDWLKSLKDRVQSKQEWSEKDKEHLNRAINILDASKVYTTSPDKYEDTIKWLKSLGSYNKQWKPSKEQIKALDIAIRFGINPSTWEWDALRSLLEQLKQL